MIVLFCGVVAYVGPRPDSLSLGLVSGLVVVGLLWAARWGWHHQSEPADAPMSEFLAAVYTLGLWVVVFLVRSTREFALWEALVILPPLGVVPLLVRVLAGDQRMPSRRARVVARRLHAVIGAVLTVLGLLFVISFYLTPVAPVPLAAAALHVHAAATYGRSLEERAEEDPRLGFMQEARPRRGWSRR